MTDPSSKQSRSRDHTQSSARFEIRLAASEGALIRTLGLIQRRGFTVNALDMQTRGDQLRLRLELAPCQRCPEILARQILRLHEVAAVDRLKGRNGARARPQFARALAGLFAPRPRVVVDGAKA